MMTLLDLITGLESMLIALSVAPPTDDWVYRLTAAGWLVMLLSVGGVTSLLGWCIWRVFRSPRGADHLHAPPDIDTRDRG